MRQLGSGHVRGLHIRVLCGLKDKFLLKSLLLGEALYISTLWRFHSSGPVALDFVSSFRFLESAFSLASGISQSRRRVPVVQPYFPFQSALKTFPDHFLAQDFPLASTSLWDVGYHATSFDVLMNTFL